LHGEPAPQPCAGHAVSLIPTPYRASEISFLLRSALVA
jgi:hypothetical protein